LEAAVANVPLTTAQDDRPTPTRAQVTDHLAALEGHADPAVRERAAQLRLYLDRRGSQHGFHELLEGIHDRIDLLATAQRVAQVQAQSASLPPQPPPPAVAAVVAAAAEAPPPAELQAAAAAATPPAPPTAPAPASKGERITLALGPVKLEATLAQLGAVVLVVLALLGAATARDMLVTAASDEDLAIPVDLVAPANPVLEASDHAGSD
jgi:hypothetical protein